MGNFCGCKNLLDGNQDTLGGGNSFVFCCSSCRCHLLTEDCWVCKNNSTRLPKPQNMNIITKLLAWLIQTAKKSSVQLCYVWYNVLLQICKNESLQQRSSLESGVSASMLGLTYEEIASRLSVDPPTVWRAVQRFEEHGTVDSCYTHEGRLKNSQHLTNLLC